MFIQKLSNNFNDVSTRVKDLCASRKDVTVTIDQQNLMPTDVGSYTDFGLRSFGNKVRFPAPFVQQVAETNPELAEEIITDRVHQYFQNSTNPFVARYFGGKVAGVVSDKYAYFDDDEVIDILADSPLSKLAYVHTSVQPERLHLRAIDADHPFKIEGDESNLYFTYFIDNSMVGGSSFKVRVGIYRQVCSNGLIVAGQDFTVCRQIHLGKRDIAAKFNENVAFLSEKREDLIQAIQDSAQTQSKIEELTEDFQKDYLARKLNASNKEVDKVLELYHLTYKGKTKWALTNAITEFARDIKDVERRTYLESLALKVS